jgi:hypothetical protein
MTHQPLKMTSTCFQPCITDVSNLMPLWMLMVLLALLLLLNSYITHEQASWRREIRYSIAVGIS